MSLPLPPPKFHAREGFDYYTADHMQAYGQACRAAALEEAAQICETSADCCIGMPDKREMVLRNCAAAIRASSESLTVKYSLTVQDAYRYQWLRDSDWIGEDESNPMRGKELDDAIDNAMKEKK